MDKTALVTGANKGIGLEICRQLADKDFKVILTSRDRKKGEKAVKKLDNENIIFHQLDVTKEKSVERAFKFVKKEFKKLDVLVNNAGILIDFYSSGLTADFDKIRETLETNTYGALRVSIAFAPLLKKSKDGRIINMSSGMGQLSEMESMVPGYRISKTALNAVTMILANELEGKVKVNSMCPGWVKTDMGGKMAKKTVKEGADTATWLATKNKTTGKFFRDRKEIDW